MIRIANLCKTYNYKKANAFQALYNVNLHIESGTMTAIIGASGAGKSTLLHILACIDHYESGEYYLDGELVKSESEKSLALTRNEKIGMVMQDFALVEDFSALQNVLLPLDFCRKKESDKKKKALAALESVGMADFAHQRSKNLSGGQKQRVAIARAIVNDPKILFADEPTGALDSKNSAEIMKLFKTLNKQGRTIVIVTHDANVAKQCDRTIEISDGRVVGSTAV